jgi:hypothetical protein
MEKMFTCNSVFNKTCDAIEQETKAWGTIEPLQFHHVLGAWSPVTITISNHTLVPANDFDGQIVSCFN